MITAKKIAALAALLCNLLFIIFELGLSIPEQCPLNLMQIINFTYVYPRVGALGKL